MTCVLFDKLRQVAVRGVKTEACAHNLSTLTVCVYVGMSKGVYKQQDKLANLVLICFKVRGHKSVKLVLLKDRRPLNHAKWLT